MKPLQIIALISIAMLVACVAPAVKTETENRGKTLFNDPQLGGGTSGRSCGTCHPDGKGLERIVGMKEWKTPAGDIKTVEEVVNICITMALTGKALDVESGEMKDLVSYINTLKPNVEKAKKKRKSVPGC